MEKKESDGISEATLQRGITYMVSHPDRWVSRRELQTELGICKTQAHRLITALSSRLPVEGNDEEKTNKTLIRLSSEAVKHLGGELMGISSLTNEDRILLSVILGMAETSGHYGKEVGELKSHLIASRFLPNLIPVYSASSSRQSLSPEKMEILNTILSAIENKKVLSLTYRIPSGQVKKYSINPIGVFEQDGSLYLYSFNSRWKNRQVNSVCRIIKASELEENSIVPEELYDTSALLDPFGIATDYESTTVEVWIDQDQAFFVLERKWPADTVITGNEDGSINMKINTKNIWACRKWILGMGSQAKVISPETLVDDIKETLTQALGHYQAPAL